MIKVRQIMRPVMQLFSKQKQPSQGVMRSGEERQRGFSLLEILIVLAIMGMIAALVAPRLFQQIDKSQQTVAETQVRSIMVALDTFRLDVGRYPTTQEGLDILLAPPTDSNASRNWHGPYIEIVPLDPWGAPYRYSPPARDTSGFETSPSVFTLGADNAPGGVGLDTDLGKVPDQVVS